MNSGLIGSFIAGGYSNIDLRGYNIPLIHANSKITSGTILIKLIDKLFSTDNVNFNNVAKTLMAYSKVVNDNLYLNVKELSDYHLSIIYFFSLINERESLSKEIIKKSPTYLISLIDQLNNKLNDKDILDEKVSVLYLSDYRELMSFDSEQSKITKSIVLGFKAGIEAHSFNDAVRRVLYSGFSSDISLILADVIARKRGFFPDVKLESEACLRINNELFNLMKIKS